VSDGRAASITRYSGHKENMNEPDHSEQAPYEPREKSESAFKSAFGLSSGYLFMIFAAVVFVIVVTILVLVGLVKV
jgi:hypothetical protein